MSRSMYRSSRARGFTLIEMMVVVAILGIVTTLAVVTVRPNTRPVDVARRLGNMVEQGSRWAVRYGPVPSALAASAGGTRRTRITATATTPPTFTLELLTGTTTPVWSVLDTYTPPSGITITWSTGVGTYAALSGTMMTTWPTFAIAMEPNGSANSTTLFFSSTRGANMDRNARLSVMPLGTAAFVRNNWL